MIFSSHKVSHIHTAFLIIFLVTLSFLYISFSLQYSAHTGQTHFTDLSYAFLHGKTNMDPMRVIDDYAVYKGKYYNYFGPLPGILLIPFVAIFGLDTPQTILVIFSVIISTIVLYRICTLLGIKKKSDALWLTAFFIFGSIYIFLSITNITAFSVQIVGTTFVILALYVFLEKWNPVLMGFFVACAGMTRPTLYIAAFFFILEFLKSKNKLRTICYFSIPIMLSIVILGFYNAVRFQNPFETGYGHIITVNQAFVLAQKQGMFGLAHIPGNLYFLLFRGPDVVRADELTYILKFPYFKINEWGLGIFFTSPLFVYLLFMDLKEKYVTPALLTSLIALFVILTYYNSGLWQYGYRYALDFYPFIFLILISVLRKQFPVRAKVLIVYSILLGLFYSYSVFGIYPLFK